MNRNPVVSVIVPVYNSDKVLIRCLDSIMKQTLKEIEIICVNDGSTDNSLRLLEESKKRDNRIVILNQDNSGAGSARNSGLDKSKGDYLYFLDSDDFIEPTLLEKAVDAIKNSCSDIVVFRSDSYIVEDNIYNKAPWTIQTNKIRNKKSFSYKDFINDSFRVFVGWPWDKLYRKDFIVKNMLRYQEIRTSNDMAFVLSSVVYAEKICILDDVLVHHCVDNGESLSHTREKSWDCFYKALIQLKNNLIRKGIYEELKKDFINYSLHISLWNIKTINNQISKLIIENLINQWEEELEIKNKKQRYFYNTSEYQEYMEKVHSKQYSYFEKTIRKLNNIRISFIENGIIYTINRVLYHLHLKEDNDLERSKYYL